MKSHDPVLSVLMFICGSSAFPIENRIPLTVSLAASTVLLLVASNVCYAGVRLLGAVYFIFRG